MVHQHHQHQHLKHSAGRIKVAQSDWKAGLKGFSPELEKKLTLTLRSSKHKHLLRSSWEEVLKLGWESARVEATVHESHLLFGCGRSP